MFIGAFMPPQGSTEQSMREEGELARSGSTLKADACTRAGFLPISLTCVPLEALINIDVFLRLITNDSSGQRHQFSLYSGARNQFRELHRQRLMEAGVQFVYIPIAAHQTFRMQFEKHLDT